RAETLPFADDSFDQLILSQILPYVSDVETAVREANRVLKKNGTLIVAVPDSRRIGWRIFGMVYRLLPNVRSTQSKVQHRFSRSLFVDLLADNGFRTLKYRYIFGAELLLKCQKVESASATR